MIAMKTRPINYDSVIKEKRLKKYRELLIGEMIVYSPWVKSYRGIITEIDEFYAYQKTSPHYIVYFFDITNNNHKRISQTCFEMNKRVRDAEENLKKNRQNP